MPRRTVPSIDMHYYGQEHLRAEGIVVMPLMESMQDSPKRARPHYHDFFQVSIVSGNGTLMHDFREQDLKGPTLFFLRPGQVHTIGARHQLKGTVISFTQEFFDHKTPPPSRLYDLPFFSPGATLPWLLLDDGTAPPFRRMFNELQVEFDAALPEASEALRALLHILFVRAGRIYSATQPAVKTSRGSILARRFCLEVEHRFREWHSLPPFAKQLSVSVNHLNEMVSEHTGHPAGDILRQRRLLDAKRLLLHSDLSISEIGYQLGFEDPSYFSRFFRRYACSTPARFREEIREKYQSGQH